MAKLGQSRFEMSRRLFLFPSGGLVAGLFLGRWWGSMNSQPLFRQGGDPGQLYHESSKTTSGDALQELLTPEVHAPLYKTYPGAPGIDLPFPSRDHGLSVSNAIAQRRSIRNYSDRGLLLPELSQLVYAAAGLTRRTDRESSLRAAPSAGALYPIELYLGAWNIVDVPPGIYHYAPWEHRIELIRAGNLRDELFRAGLAQPALLASPLVIGITGIFSRMRWKYADRTYRYMLLEAGHISENIYLAATAGGLAACAIGSFLDDDVNRVLGIDGNDEVSLLLVAVRPR